jgi:prepilin-type N-terminal cleavage/methylation domain-containing protein/prepilin-type processing-associated H-X9-DG protein
MMSHPRPRCAFSLVELLVAIFIIALLIGILIPTFSRARAAGNRAACGAQLRDIGNLFQMYLNDSRGRLPKIDPMPLRSPRLFPADPTLFDAFDPYTRGSRKVWTCPADHLIEADRYTASGNYASYAEAYGTSYEYNLFMNSFFGGDMFEKALERAKQMGITPDRHRIFNDFTYFHGKKGQAGNMNFLFADWHVSDLAGSSSGQDASPAQKPD